MIAAARKEVASSRRQCELVTLAVAACEDGAGVFDAERHRLYSSQALTGLLAEDADRELLERTIDDACHALLARPTVGESTERSTKPIMPGPAWALGESLTLQVRTSEMEYRLHATSAADGIGSAGKRFCVVWVRRCKPRLLTGAILTERYGLTPREVRVSTLLVARLRSREIAEVLGISVHTARRHAEAVLRKLGVCSRTELRDRLRVDGAPSD